MTRKAIVPMLHGSLVVAVALAMVGCIPMHQHPTPTIVGASPCGCAAYVPAPCCAGQQPGLAPEPGDGTPKTPGNGSFPGKPIQVGPGTSGNLEWKEQGSNLPANDTNAIRNDFESGTQYIVAFLPGNTGSVDVEYVEFKVNYTIGDKDYVSEVVLNRSASCMNWATNGFPIQMCDWTEPECAGVPPAFLGQLNGDIKVRLVGESVLRTAESFKFKPVLLTSCE